MSAVWKGLPRHFGCAVVGTQFCRPVTPHQALSCWVSVLQVWAAKYGGGREGVGRLVSCMSELLLVPLNIPSTCGELQMSSTCACKCPDSTRHDSSGS